MTRKIILLTVLMSLVGIKITSSQEWQFSIESDTLEGYGFTSNVTELSNGNLLMPCNHAFRYNPHEHATICPSIILLSKDGKELARNDFFRPGYCLMSHGQAFEKNNSLYYLTTYTPEHTQNCFNNHFENSDNPPSDGKLVLMKLDDQLNMEECYEHSWPVDTYEDHGGIWEIYPNGFSGNIYLFTAFEEDDNIVGAYWKSVSYDSPSRGNDTLFFFRMNFDGEMLLKKVAKVDVGKGNRYLAEEESANDRGLKTNYFRGDHFVSTDYGYIFYVKGDGAPNNSYLGAGRAMYYDKDFNLLRTRYVKFNNPYHGETIGDFNVCRSNHNTTYLSSQMRSPDDPSGDEDCCLYELDDDIDAESNWIDNINYIHRKTDEWDQPSFLSSVDLIDDNSLCYVYELYEGLGGNLDSYLVIEHLDNNFDTISTFYYGVDNRMQERVYCIKRVSDGVIIIHDKTALDIDYFSSCITKFPATAFGFEPDNIEEAHAHNLHLAVAYPNPGGDVLNIRTGLRNATLQVYDMQGRIIHQQIITDEVTSVDASKWSSGTYVWKLKTENGKLEVEEGKWVK